MVILPDTTTQYLVQIFSCWPFDWDNEKGEHRKPIKSEIMLTFIPHHAFSLITIAAIISGLVEEPAVQKPGVFLMLAGASHVSYVIFSRTCYLYRYNNKSEKRKVGNFSHLLQLVCVYFMTMRGLNDCMCWLFYAMDSTISPRVP